MSSGQTSLEYLLILAGSVMIVVLMASVLKGAMAPGMENLGDNSTPVLWAAPSATPLDLPPTASPSPSASPSTIPTPSPSASPSPSPTPVNGVCGASNGISTSFYPPSSGLCLAGTASASGSWTWKCVGLYGGTNASCSATQCPHFSAGTHCQSECTATGNGVATTSGLTWCSMYKSCLSGWGKYDNWHATSPIGICYLPSAGCVYSDGLVTGGWGACIVGPGHGWANSAPVKDPCWVTGSGSTDVSSSVPDVSYYPDSFACT